MSTQIEVMSKGKDVGVNRPRFLDVKELAEMLRRKTRTIYDMVSEGRIPIARQGIGRSFCLTKYWIGQSRIAKGNERFSQLDKDDLALTLSC